MDAILTGEPIDARRAFDLGLVSRLVEPDAALDEALRLARQIVSAAPLAVRASRSVVLTAAAEHDDMLKQVSRQLLDELLDVIHRYPDHVWVFLHEFPALTAERAEQFRGRRRKYERRVEAILQAGIDSGEFREVDPRLTALAWLGMHNYTYLWLKVDGRLSARDVAKRFGELFIRGIATT